jgi:hypothetical protein
MTFVRSRDYKKAIKLITEKYDIPVLTDGRKDCLSASSFCWNESNQRIMSGTKGPPFLVLMAIAHELGHCLSVRRGSKSSFALQLKYNFNAKLSKKEKKAILAEEYAAWRLGFKFLRDNKLPVTDRMHWAKRILMGTHFKKLKKS